MYAYIYIHTHVMPSSPNMVKGYAVHIHVPVEVHVYMCTYENNPLSYQLEEVVFGGQ